MVMGLFILLFLLHRPGYILSQDIFFWIGMLFLSLSLQLKEQQSGREAAMNFSISAPPGWGSWRFPWPSSEKGNTLYTMWWYDSGRQQTGSQWDWRWQSLNGQEAFYLVNITSESPAILQAEAQAFLEQKIIK